MAASTEQKVDFLLKKLGYSSSKTGNAEDGGLSGTTKAPFAEAIPSPLVVPDSSVWSNSEWIPTTPPGSDTSYVKTYLASASGLRMTVDPTVAGNRAFVARTTYGDNNSANLKNWIDTQFGPDYVIKVYVGDPNSGGSTLDPAGAGASTNDTWFFDYSSGVLSFNGTNVPTSVTSSNVYIVGYRYIGETGVLTPGDDFETRNLKVNGISTFTGQINADSNVVIAGNLTVNGTETVLNTTSLEVEDINIGIASAASKLNDAQIDGAGLTIYSSAGDKTLTWDNSNSRMAFSTDLYAPNISVGSSVTVGTDLTVGGNLNVTGDIVYDEVTGRNIYISGVGTFFGSKVHLKDNTLLTFGDTNDLQISHNGTDSIIKDAGVGRLKILGGFQVKNVGDTETLITANQSGSNATNVELYHSNIKRFETISTGATVTGDLGVSGNVLVGGALTVTGTTTFNGGTLTFGDADTDNVVFGADVDSNVIPDDDNTFDLGTSAKRWKDVYAANFHGDGSNLTNTGASLSAASGTQRLVVTNLTSGTMTTAATDSDLVFIAAHNLLSLNGNLSVTGVATFTGPITAGSSLGADGQYMRRTGAGVTWASFPKLRETVKFTATAGQTSFTWTHNVDFLDVFLNGVKLASTEYSNNGTSVTLDSGCFAGDIVEFHSWNVASNYGAGGGGSTTLPGLTDVTISGVSNGQVLKYNGSAWVNATDATGSSYSNSDVDAHLNVSGASSGQILSWNGSDYAWVADQTGGGGGAAGLWSQNSLGIHTLSNVGIGTTTIPLVGAERAGLTVSGIGTFGDDLHVAGNLNVFGSTNLESQTLNANNLIVSGVTTHSGITTYTNHVNFGGLNKQVTFFGHSNLVDKKMYWDTSGSGSLHFADGVHSYYGTNMRTHIDPHGTGSAGHFRIEQYMDDGDNQLQIHSDFVHLQGSPTGAHEQHDIAKFEYLDGTRLYHTDIKRLHTSGVGVTVYGELDATSANFTGNVSIGGTLTYQDVTNIDSVGIITAGTDIHVGAGVSAVGIITANSFRGDGSQLTGINAGGLDDGTDINPRNINASGIITATSTTIGSLGISTIAGNWGASAGVGKTVDTIDISSDDFKTAEYTAWFNCSSGGVSNIQSQKLLVMQDGSNAYSQEFAIMSAPNKVVSLSASITGNIVSILATPESGISGVTTYKLARNTLL